jgi:gamma-glutamylcyclotransferase (GGCT)/AIG2-like uncharacterized protein YtfP
MRRTTKPRINRRKCTEYLFVYGTLLSKTGNRSIDRWLKQWTDGKGPAYLYATLYNLGKYPAARPDPSKKNRVFGQLLSIRHPAKWSLLDRYEDAFLHQPQQGEFRRCRHLVYRDAGRYPTIAWVYFYNRPITTAVRIPHGDYPKFGN